jgi:hypothetical protein
MVGTPGHGGACARPAWAKAADDVGMCRSAEARESHRSQHAEEAPGHDLLAGAAAVVVLGGDPVGQPAATASSAVYQVSACITVRQSAAVPPAFAA